MKKVICAFLAALAALSSAFLFSCSGKTGGDGELPASEKKDLPIVRINVEDGRNVEDRSYKNVTVSVEGADDPEYDFTELAAETKYDTVGE